MKKYVITATDGTERAIYRKSFDEALDQAIRENACCIKNERGVMIAGSQSNPKACFEEAEKLMRDFPYSREDFRNAYGREPERYLDYYLLEKICYPVCYLACCEKNGRN